MPIQEMYTIIEWIVEEELGNLVQNEVYALEQELYFVSYKGMSVYLSI